jgi:hypothetical protein
MIDGRLIKVGDILEMVDGKLYEVVNLAVTTNTQTRKLSFTCSSTTDELHLTLECYITLSGQAQSWRSLSAHLPSVGGDTIKRIVNQPDASGCSGGGFTFSPA